MNIFDDNFEKGTNVNQYFNETAFYLADVPINEKEIEPWEWTEHEWGGYFKVGLRKIKFEGPLFEDLKKACSAIVGVYSAIISDQRLDNFKSRKKVEPTLDAITSALAQKVRQEAKKNSYQASEEKLDKSIIQEFKKFTSRRLKKEPLGKKDEHADLSIVYYIMSGMYTAMCVHQNPFNSQNVVEILKDALTKSMNKLYKLTEEIENDLVDEKFGDVKEFNDEDTKNIQYAMDIIKGLSDKIKKEAIEAKKSARYEGTTIASIHDIAHNAQLVFLALSKIKQSKENENLKYTGKIMDKAYSKVNDVLIRG